MPSIYVLSLIPGGMMRHLRSVLLTDVHAPYGALNYDVRNLLHSQAGQEARTAEELDILCHR